MRLEDVKTIKESCGCSTFFKNNCGDCPLQVKCSTIACLPTEQFRDEKFKIIMTHNRKKKLEKLLT